MKEHAFPNGTVAVKMHKRKRLTMVVAREDLDAALVARIEELERENRILRRKVTEMTSGRVLGGESAEGHGVTVARSDVPPVGYRPRPEHHRGDNEKP
jgi:uncharacterized protein (UPF0335 family)